MSLADANLASVNAFFARAVATIQVLATRAEITMRPLQAARAGSRALELSVLTGAASRARDLRAAALQQRSLVYWPVQQSDPSVALPSAQHPSQTYLPPKQVASFAQVAGVTGTTGLGIGLTTGLIIGVNGVTTGLKTGAILVIGVTTGLKAGAIGVTTGLKAGAIGVTTGLKTGASGVTTGLKTGVTTGLKTGAATIVLPTGHMVHGWLVAPWQG